MGVTAYLNDTNSALETKRIKAPKRSFGLVFLAGGNLHRIPDADSRMRGTMGSDMRWLQSNSLLICCSICAMYLPACRTAETRLTTPRTVTPAAGKTLNRQSGADPSGVLPLASGTEAFVARLALASRAKKTLDLQYYIWRGDKTGKLLAGAVVETAERGVKARILLDDMGSAANDRSLLTLDSHPNIEVRLFNPISLRSMRMLGTLSDFGRVNRRMHNKSFTVDGQVAIVGGRNIADEYFDAADAMNFTDFDVVVRGPVVREVSDAFEQYWNCEAAVPITHVSREKVSDADLINGRRQLMEHRAQMETTRYGAALKSSKLANTPLHQLPLFKGSAIVVSDRPEKVQTRPEDGSTHLAPLLRDVVAATQKELTLVSPYFIPGKEGVAWMSELEQRGVSVKVVTNSLASTDVAAVHAGYARYREDLLNAGVEIRELKPTLTKAAPNNDSSLGLTTSSKAGLHAKTFVFDRRWVFVGSMNLDPRSLRLNTEMGIVIDSPELANQMLQRAESALTQRTYLVKKGAKGLTWTTEVNGQIVTLQKEPSGGIKKALVKSIASLLPIEGQL